MLKGDQGFMQWTFEEQRLKHKADSLVDSESEGDPDELERVEQKLLQELQLHFKAHEADISYEDYRLVLRLPARVNYDRGRPTLEPGVQATMALIADQLQRNSGTACAYKR